MIQYFKNWIGQQIKFFFDLRFDHLKYNTLFIKYNIKLSQK